MTSLTLAISLLFASLTPHAKRAKPSPPPPSGWFATSAIYKSPGTTVYPGTGGDVAYCALPQCAAGAGPLSFVTTTSTSALLGNLTGRTIASTLSLPVTGSPRFTYWGMGTTFNPGPLPAHVRLVFATQTGFSTGWTDQIWYSNPVRLDLALLAGTQATLSETLSDPSRWSNGQGQVGNTRPAAFAAATASVRQIGLAFGGGSFFDVGVGVVSGTGTATLHILTYTAQ